MSGGGVWRIVSDSQVGKSAFDTGVFTLEEGVRHVLNNPCVILWVGASTDTIDDLPFFKPFSDFLRDPYSFVTLAFLLLVDFDLEP